jgi:hypothetical protein
VKLLIFLYFLSFSSFAIDFSACDSNSEAGVKKCIREFSSSTKKFGEAPHVCTSSLVGTTKECPPLSSSFSRDGANCSNFITGNPRGSFGPWGNNIVEYLNEKGAQSIFFSNNIPGMSEGINACPKWRNLGNDEKKHFWVWMMASIAQVESRCLPNARNQNGTNGVAAGLYQLDERQAMRSWRGPNCGGRNILEPRSNIRCGLDIMEALLTGKDGVYRTNGELWGPRSRSYWEHLRRRNGGDIGSLVRQNPFCN